MTEIRKTRKHAGSTVISLTGFAQVGEHYKIEKNGNNITLSKVEA